MPPRIIGRAFIDHPRLGRINISLAAGARTIRARWIDGNVHIYAPAAATATQINAALDRWCDSLLASRPQIIAYPIGTQIPMTETVITITRDSTLPHSHIRRILRDIEARPRLIDIACAADVDTASATGSRAISDILIDTARDLAPAVLIPEAADIARLLGVEPAGWLIGHGHGVLGTCHPDKHITLSYMCMFLTPDMLRYVVCHELAHLTHMNHSPQFHRLCNAYLDGREAELRATLRRHPFPVYRKNHRPE